MKTTKSLYIPVSSEKEKNRNSGDVVKADRTIEAEPMRQARKVIFLQPNSVVRGLIKKLDALHRKPKLFMIQALVAEDASSSCR